MCHFYCLFFNLLSLVLYSVASLVYNWFNLYYNWFNLYQEACLKARFKLQNSQRRHIVQLTKHDGRCISFSVSLQKYMAKLLVSLQRKHENCFTLHVPIECRREVDIIQLEQLYTCEIRRSQNIKMAFSLRDLVLQFVDFLCWFVGSISRQFV